MPSVVRHKSDNIYRWSSLFDSENNDDIVTDLLHNNIFQKIIYFQLKDSVELRNKIPANLLI